MPAEAAEIARGTIGGAVSVAGQLPDALGAELLELGARRRSRTRSATTAAISAVIAIGVAILAAALLRRVPAPA